MSTILGKTTENHKLLGEGFVCIAVQNPYNPITNQFFDGAVFNFL